MIIASYILWNYVPTVAAQRPSPPNVSLTIAPPVLLADEKAHRTIYVRLVDSDGLPMPTNRETSISLISSNPLIARVPDAIYISEGRSYAVASLTTTLKAGRSVITAATQAGNVAVAEVETLSPNMATLPLSLALRAVPHILILGAPPPGRLLVSLRDARGIPVPAVEVLDVTLTSSNPDIVSVPKNVTIAKGSQFAIVDVTASSEGSATLSAIRSGFLPQNTDVHVVGPGESPESLEVYLLPDTTISGVGDQGEVMIQAFDDKNRPTFIPCTEINLVSSSPSLVEVLPLSEAGCSAGSQFLTSSMSLGTHPGIAAITASGSGLRPSTGRLHIQGLTPARLVAYQAPEGLTAIEAPYGFIVIQAQDASGIPVNVHDDVTVRIIGGEDVLPREVVIPSPQNFVAFTLEGIPLENIGELWFTSPDLLSAHLAIKSRSLPLDVKFELADRPWFPGGRYEILARVKSVGRPITLAKTSWDSTRSGLELGETSHTTNENGEARAFLTAWDPRDTGIRLTVVKENFESTVAVVTVAPPKLLGISVWYWYLILAGLLFIVGFSSYKAIRRLMQRRRPYQPHSDLSMSIAVSEATPDEGKSVVYTVTLINHGPDDATGVRVNSSLPAVISFLSALSSQGEYDSGRGEWHVGALGTRHIATLTLTGMVFRGARGKTITATASVSADQDHLDISNNPSSVDIRIPVADLGVVIGVDKTRPHEGEVVTYTIKLINHGPDEATGVRVNSLLPAGISFLSALPSQGDYDSGRGEWHVGPIERCHTANLMIAGNIQGGCQGAVIATSASVTLEQADPNTINNSSSIAIEVANGKPALQEPESEVKVEGTETDTSPVRLELSVTVDNSKPLERETISYTIEATNVGPADANDVEVTYMLPAGLAFLSASPAQGSYAKVVPTVGVWKMGRLARRESTHLTVRASVNRNTVGWTLTSVAFISNPRLGKADIKSESVDIKVNSSSTF